MPPVYFDHNATTPLDPRVREAMLPWIGERWGNPSSVHGPGRAAREAVEEARERLAGLLAADPHELVFTASGTEANNAAISSCAGRAGFRGHLVLSAVEHSSVGAAADRLAERGVEVTRVAPDAAGRVDPAEMLGAVREETFLVCLMLANNEVGTLQPVAEVAAECRRRGVPLLCDAVQAVGKIPVDVGALGADFVTLAGHKFHGPSGAAALWIRRGTPFEALLVGGRQERRRRAGTVNVPAVVGLGRAAELARAELPARGRAMAALRERFEAGLETVGDATIHGRGAERLPNTSNVRFGGVDGEALLIRLDLAGFALSTGSACSSGALEPSRTLLAMGVGEDDALGSLRVSFAAVNTESEVDALLAALEREVATLRRLAAGGRG